MVATQLGRRCEQFGLLLAWNGAVIKLEEFEIDALPTPRTRP